MGTALKGWRIFEGLRERLCPSGREAHHKAEAMRLVSLGTSYTRREERVGGVSPAFGETESRAESPELGDSPPLETQGGA